MTAPQGSRPRIQRGGSTQAIAKQVLLQLSAGLEDPTLPTELSGELRAAVERWAAQQLDKPTLAEAVRRLVEDGLATD
jgi:hypothetical protein